MAHRRDHVSANAKSRNGIVAENSAIVRFPFGGLNGVKCLIEPSVSQWKCFVSRELWTVLIVE
jgi:hypothetical protein